METKDYIIGTLTIALLISLGFAVQPDDTHLCRDLMITMQCNRLSSTGFTCYPLPVVRTGSKYCSSGWEPILKEAPKAEEYKSKKWLCSVESCERIE